MDKDLPNIYKGNVSNDNNQNESILGEKKDIVFKRSVDDQIRDVFNSPDFVYKADTFITLNNGDKIKKTIIGRSNNSLITIDDELINVKDIESIELI